MVEGSPGPGVPPVTVHVPTRAIRPGEAGDPPTVVVDASAHPELAARLRFLAGHGTGAPFATWNDAAADWGLAVLAIALPDPDRGEVDRVLATTVSVLELGGGSVRLLVGADVVHLDVVLGADRIGPIVVRADPAPLAQALAGAEAGAVATAPVRPLRLLGVAPPAPGAAPPRPVLRLDAVGAADVVRRIVEAIGSGARVLTVWQAVDEGLVLVLRVGDLPSGARAPVFVSVTFPTAAGTSSDDVARLADVDAFVVELVDGAAVHHLVAGHDRVRLAELLGPAVT